FQSGPTVISVVPEEVATPDDEHPLGDVERPLVRLDTDSQRPEMARLLADRLGKVRHVNVISTFTGFSEVVNCEPQELIHGVTLPRSKGYHRLYFSHAEPNHGALIDLDVAVEIVTDNCPGLVFYTRGYFIHTSTSGLPPDEPWVTSD